MNVAKEVWPCFSTHDSDYPEAYGGRRVDLRRHDDGKIQLLHLKNQFSSRNREKMLVIEAISDVINKLAESYAK
jgi:hypothetical protein